MSIYNNPIVLAFFDIEVSIMLAVDTEIKEGKKCRILPEYCQVGIVFVRKVG